MILFITIYNLLFIFILNLQYIIRFNKPDDFSSALMFSSIMSISLSIIPFGCFIISCFINKFMIRKLKIHPVLKSALQSLLIVFPTYIIVEIVYNDPFATLIMLDSTTLTLILLYFMNKPRETVILIEG